AVAIVELAAQRADRRVGAEQRVRRRPAERDDDARRDGSDARLEKRLACRYLVGLRVAVPRWPAAHDVVDVDGLPRPSHRVDHSVEQLAGRTDERLAALVLLLARSLADEHQGRVLVADAEHDRPARRVQLAARAVAEL